jgi:LacI family transcriptional regulator
MQRFPQIGDEEMKKRKKITLQNIAQKLGLSTAAVSKALSGHPGIGEQTRREVEETAAKLGYDKRRKRSSLAANDESEEQLVVLLFVERHNLTDPHFTSVYLSLDRELKAGGCRLDLLPVDLATDTPSELRLPAVKPHVNLLFGLIPEGIAAKLIQSGIPSIAFDNEYHLAPQIDSIGANDYAGAYLAVRHLFENGHRHIGFIGDHNLSPSFCQRGHGFLDAMRRFGLPIDERCIINLQLRNADGSINLDSIHESLLLEHMPTAFFCANDPIAFYVSQKLVARGIDVPGQVSLIGFDNLEAAKWNAPPLTTIHFPRENVGILVMEMIRRRLAEPNGTTIRTLLNPHLVVRQSVAARPQSSHQSDH